MDDQTQPPEPEGRLVGGTEWSWYKAVPGGTGITVLALLLSRPLDPSILRTTLQKLQNSHPILRAKLTPNSPNNNNNTPFFSISPNPSVEVQTFDASATRGILDHESDDESRIAISPFHSLLGHELNRNPWTDRSDDSSPSDLFFATSYAIPDSGSSSSSVLALRFHSSVCDRTSGVSVLRELLALIGAAAGDGDGGGVRTIGEGDREEVVPPIEELIPSEHSYKPFWAKGRDLIGYSLNFKRSANLPFEDAASPRSSEVARLQLTSEETQKLLSACRAKGIKLCGALTAAGLIATVSSKHLDSNQWETYSVVTLVDCRKYLNPALGDNNLGFYHSAIQNTHTVHGGEDLWGLSARCYHAFSDAKNNRKHLTDVGDLNLLMCKAIDNPYLTPSSSMRTALISVFEDPATDDGDGPELYGSSSTTVGVEDSAACASIHGVGPSIAVFDTVRDGRLDCACVYPSPLHSREQMQKLVEDMKRILMSGCEVVI